MLIVSSVYVLHCVLSSFSYYFKSYRKLSLFRKMRGLEGEAGRLASQVTRAWKRLVIFYDGPPLGRRTQETAH